MGNTIGVTSGAGIVTWYVFVAQAIAFCVLSFFLMIVNVFTVIVIGQFCFLSTNVLLSLLDSSYLLDQQ
jgi:hypothetical protein